MSSESYEWRPLDAFSEGRGSSGKPSLVVLHYTAGNSLDSAIAAMAKRKVSAHYVVGLEGEIVQCVKEEDRAYHAGDAVWNGSSLVNGMSIGIEIVNFGWGREDSLGLYREETVTKEDGTKKKVRVGTTQLASRPPDGRPEWKNHSWAAYAQKQQDAVVRLVLDIQNRNRIGSEALVGHEHVSPGRKQDPGPAFRPVWLALDTAFDAWAKASWPDALMPAFNSSGKVKAVQSHIDRMGLYQGDPDGSWGPKTQAGVEAALKQHAALVPPGLQAKPESALHLSRAFRLVPGYAHERQ